MSDRREELGQKIKDFNSTGAKIRRLEAELAALAEADKWIPVSERLPDEFVPVLVVGKSGDSQYVTSALVTWEWDDTGAGWCWNQHHMGWLSDMDSYQFDDDYEYTHWMPLPEPPSTKEQRDETP